MRFLDDRSLLGLLVVGAMLCASPVLAQEAPATDPAADTEIQAVLVEAVREYDAGNYEEAYALFLRVHSLRPTARTERALGKTAFGLRRYREAVRWLAAALDDTRQPLTAEMRAEVDGFLLRARSFLGRYTLEVSPPNAAVEVDGAPLAERSVELEIGDHDFIVRAPGHETTTRRVSVRGGENETVEIALLETPTGPAPQTIVVAAQDPGGTQRDLGWASVITGGALVAGAAIASILWSDAVASLNANIDRGVCAVDSNETVVSGAAVCVEQQTRYRITLPLQYVGYVSGAALLGVGIALIASAPSSTAESEALTCAPGFLSVACRATF